MNAELLKLNFSAKNLLVFCLTLSPLFLLTVSGWMTSMHFVCVIVSLYILYIHRTNKTSGSSIHISSTWALLLSTTFLSPFVAVLIGQTFRQEFSWSYYDSPAHILFCIPILFAILQTRIKNLGYLAYVFPASTLVTIADVFISPNLYWGATRVTTHALDPLAFGSLSLTFGLLSLVSIELHEKNSIPLNLFKILGFLAGVYLSVLSGSRTGWLAVFLILIIWLIFKGAKFRAIPTIMAILLTIIFSLSIYKCSSNVSQRVNTALAETLNYEWNKTNTETSVGSRISFVRIAIFLFVEKPLSGWGDAGFSSVINAPELEFADLPTKKTALNAGFHNEITANMVRSGIWGLISSISLFLIPGWFFISNLREESESVRRVALLASTFLICEFVSSLSMELLNLKYAASFYALTITIFFGWLIVATQSNSTKV